MRPPPSSPAGCPLAATSLAVAAAALGFLAFNFHPARIFLGDVGSIPLGFLAGALGVVGWRNDVWPLWFPLLVFGPFIGDATLTLLKRALRRERVWRAHTRALLPAASCRMGLGHRGAALIGYAAMLLCAAAALFGRQQAPELQAATFGAASLVARRRGRGRRPALAALRGRGRRRADDRGALLAFLHDVTAAALAWCFAFWLRFNFESRRITTEVDAPDAAVGRAAPRRRVLGVRPVSRPVALRQPAGPEAHPASRSGIAALAVPALLGIGAARLAGAAHGAMS